MYARPANLPADTLCQCSFSREWVATDSLKWGGWDEWGGSESEVSRKAIHCFKAGGVGRGWRDFFDVGPMPGGFDEAAWAAKGLPTSGQIVLKLTVNAL